MAATTKASDAVDFLVRRDDLHRTTFAPVPLPALEDGQVLLKIDAFAFTANNVTYAVFGAMMRYWDFFPAAEGWGRVPVWGFADVAVSHHPEVVASERFYGYFPMSTHLIVHADHVTAGGFVDAASHRKDLPAVYNGYMRTTTDPGYDPKREDAQMLLRPLFMTAFLIDDFLEEQGFHDASAIALSSASSKTAIGLAALLSARVGRSYEVIGLTSPANRAFVTGLGYYDRVVPYDDLASLPNDRPLVFVDMAGNGAVRDLVHRHCRDRLRYSCAVGGTHWDQMAPTAADLPGAPPTFFFAPDRIRQRGQDWGMAELQSRMGVAWKVLVDRLDRWMKVRRGRGHADVERVYRATLDGTADPADGHVLSL
jgi:Protein of unknown function (DUF2855)